MDDRPDRPGRRRLANLVVAVCTLMLAAACGSTAGGAPNTAGRSGDPVGTVTVAAAASLTAAFKELGTEFERAHPGATVRFNFAGSSTLVTQLVNGAPGDVFASADEATMKKVTQAHLADGSPQIFARNKLAIVVSAGNPHRIAGLADLSRPGLVISMCAPQVPIGQYARQAYAKAGLPFPAGASQELDVKQVVSRVQQGQADAGIVYATDVTAGGSRVTGVAIPDSANVLASYPVAALLKGANPAGGRAFTAYLTSAQAQTVLAKYGFLAP
jgi:molybdate transport system substrate-binding protein